MLQRLDNVDFQTFVGQASNALKPNAEFQSHGRHFRTVFRDWVILNMICTP